MYWNSDRIFADIDNWTIFVKLENGEPIGNIYYMNDDDCWFEIFGLEIKDDLFNPELFCDLLNKALNEAKKHHGKYMTFFCDKEYQKTVEKSGFTCVGEYVCFKKKLD